jgi:hypothetical protein
MDLRNIGILPHTTWHHNPEDITAVKVSKLAFISMVCNYTKAYRWQHKVSQNHYVYNCSWHDDHDTMVLTIFT